MIPHFEIKNIFADMELIVEGELHFVAHDGACLLCGKSHPNTYAMPAYTYTTKPDQP